MDDVSHDHAVVTASGPGYDAFPYVIVRVPGVARSRLREYRCDEALERHARARALADRVRQLADPLRHSLFELVPQLPARARRGALAARRALFRGNPIPGGDWVHALVAHSPVVANELARWGSLREEWRAAVEARDRCFNHGQQDRDDALVDLCRDRQFRLALTLANPALARTLSMITPGRPMDRRERGALRRGMRYLLRAALRPTPRSFFCSSAVAPLSGAPSATSMSPERASQLQVNRELLAPVFTALANRPSFRARANIRLAALAFVDEEGAWTFDGSRYRSVDRAAYERLASLPSDGVLRAESRFADAEISAWVASGLAEIGWGVSDEHADDVEILLRLVWEAAFTDVELLSVVPILTAVQAGAAMATDRRRRDAVLVELTQCAAKLPGCHSQPVAVVFEDTWCEAPAVPPVTAFLREIVHFGADLIWPHPMPEEQSLAAVFLRLNGSAPIRLLRFHRQYLDVCQALGLGVDHWLNSPHLCRWLGLTPVDPVNEMQETLEGLLANLQVEDLQWPADATGFTRATTGRPQRISLRFAPASGGRFHPVFWGGEKMSLLPRYARLPFSGVDLAAASRAWFARWPSLADIYGALGRNVDLRPPVTRRRIEAPGARPGPDTLPLRDLWVRLDDDRLVVAEGSGEPVTPIFLGVSVPSRLPPIHQFLFHLSDRRTSFLECAMRAVNQLIVRRMRRPAERVTRLPSVALGEHILLCGPAFIVPRAALPDVGSTIRDADFFRFHDWLAENRLPRLAEAWADGRAPAWVDLSHPLGIKDLIAHARGASAILLRPPPLADGEGAVAGTGEEFGVELYVELAAGAAHT